MSESKVEEVESGLLEGLIEALGNKHSQLDVNFQRTKVTMPGTQVGVELNGVVTLTVHMRELTEDEKKASAEKSIALMSSK
jgi:hypothetical protein